MAASSPVQQSQPSSAVDAAYSIGNWEQTTCKKTGGHTGCVNPSLSWHSRRFHAWWARHSLCCQEAHGESRWEAGTNMKSQLLIPWSVITITDYRTWLCLGTLTPAPSTMLSLPFTCHTLKIQQKHLQISDFGVRDLPVTQGHGGFPSSLKPTKMQELLSNLL